jgi:hypothetical protein
MVGVLVGVGLGVMVGVLVDVLVGEGVKLGVSVGEGVSLGGALVFVTFGGLVLVGVRRGAAFATPGFEVRLDVIASNPTRQIKNKGRMDMNFFFFMRFRLPG